MAILLTNNAVFHVFLYVTFILKSENARVPEYMHLAFFGCFA